MSLTPKHSKPTSATRQFTDREEFIEAFKKALIRPDKAQHKILVYYGVGGIGKTTLRKELGKILQNEYAQTVWSVVDFDTPSHRDEETALLWLRKSLFNKYKIQFPTFEIAFGFLWQKTHPQIPLTRDNCSLIDEGSILSDIVDIAGDMPFISAVAGGIKAVMKGQKHIAEWWNKHGQKEIYSLAEMEPKEILERLPSYWASDLNNYLESKKLDAVIFLDTYEAMWEGERGEGKTFSRDEWVRELVASLPRVLWVICGREKLRWDELDAEWAKYAEQHLIGSLSDIDAQKFLNSCGIADKDVCAKIVKSSKGTPYYLDLAVDTFMQIRDRHKREPEPADFAKTPREVLDRFLKYLDRAEVETLKILSAPRFFDYDIFEKLVTHFKTGYPLTAFEELCRFSFIEHWQHADSWAMHDLMRDALQEYLPEDLKKRTHKFMFDYYAKRLENVDTKDISNIHKQDLVEALHHGKNALDVDELYNWLGSASIVFGRAAKLKFLVQLYEDFLSYLEKKFEPSHSLIANCLQKLGGAFWMIDRSELAEPLHKRALEINMNIYRSNHPELAKSMMNLGQDYFELRNFTKAEALLKSALEMMEQCKDIDDKLLAYCMSELGRVYGEQDKFSSAEALFNHAIEIQKRKMGHGSISTYGDIINLYFRMGRFVEAEPLIMLSLELTKTYIDDRNPYFAVRLMKLAQAKMFMGSYKESEQLFKNVLEIFENGTDGEEIWLMCSLIGMAELNIIIDKYTEAKSLLNRALAIAESFPLNREAVVAVARIYMDFGELHRTQKLFLDAEDFFRKALQKAEAIYEPDFLILVESLSGFSKNYNEQGKYGEAESLLKRALKISEKAYVPEHPKVIEMMNNLVDLYKIQGCEAEVKELEKCIAEKRYPGK